MKWSLPQWPRAQALAASVWGALSHRDAPKAGTLLTESGHRRWKRLAIDTGVVFTLCVLVGITFIPVYGIAWTWLTVIGGSILGIAVGIVGALRRWRSLSVAASIAGLYFLFGGLLAMPSSTIAGFIPTMRTLSRLAAGFIHAWRESLTLAAPIGETDALLVVPLISMMVASVAATSIAVRSVHPGLAWIPIATAGLVGILWGTENDYMSMLIGLGFVSITVVWTSYRRTARQRLLLRGKSRFGWTNMVSGVIMLAVSMGLVFAIGPQWSPEAQRAHLRAVIEPPVNVSQYPSPLQSFRANHSEYKDSVLLTVTGLPKGARVRLAALDSFDGHTMRVPDETRIGMYTDAGTFRRIGAQTETNSASEPVPVSVEIGSYSDVWMPTVGETRALIFTGDRQTELSTQLFYNRATATALNTAGLRAGDTYDLSSVVDKQPSTEQIRAARQGSLDLPAMDPIPDVVRDLAQRWAGSAQTTGEAALAIQTKLQAGYYSNGVEKEDAESLPGHSYQRIAALLSNENKMIGDEEQYASTFALMARHLGIPSRVVYGYIPSSDAETVQITGSDVSAWTELYFEKLGWVTFNPTPDKDRVPKVEEVPDQVKARPQVENPPPPPVRPDRLPPEDIDPKPPKGKNEDQWNVDWRLVAGITAGVGIPLVVIVLPVALIIGAKLRRRKSRMTLSDIANRVAGGWAELTDKARDLGSTPSPYATRTEQADVISGSFPRVSEGADPQVLARLADTTVFGPEEVTSSQAQTYWAGVERASKGMMTSVPWWKRVLSWLSLRSFRRFTAK